MTSTEGFHVHDDDADDIEDTVIRPRARVGGPDPATDRAHGADAADAADAADVMDVTDDPRDDTVLRSPVSVVDPLGDTVIRVPGPRHDAGADPEDTLVGGTGTGPSAGRVRGLPDVPPSLPSVPEPTRTRIPSIRMGEQEFRLDRPVVIGRRPALPRIVRGPEPRLVTVPSPLGQVSSSHLLVHAAGEAAVIDDLHSTNGTVVRPAGAPAYRMPSGASIVALTGTVVEIGDGIAIEILSPHLRVTPPSDGLPPSAHPPRSS